MAAPLGPGWKYAGQSWLNGKLAQLSDGTQRGEAIIGMDSEMIIKESRKIGKCAVI